MSRSAQYFGTEDPMPRIGALAMAWTFGLRRLRRQSLFSIIKIGGLAIGLAAALYAAAYARFETSFGRFHPNADRIFRVTGPEFPGTPYALSDRMKSAIPGVEAATAVKRISRVDSRLSLRAGDRRLVEDRLYAAGGAVTVTRSRCDYLQDFNLPRRKRFRHKFIVTLSGRF